MPSAVKAAWLTSGSARLSHVPAVACVMTWVIWKLQSLLAALTSTFRKARGADPGPFSSRRLLGLAWAQCVRWSRLWGLLSVLSPTRNKLLRETAEGNTPSAACWTAIQTPFVSCLHRKREARGLLFKHTAVVIKRRKMSGAT